MIAIHQRTIYTSKQADLNGPVGSIADLKPKGLGFESRKRQDFFRWNLISSGCYVLEKTSSERNIRLIIGTLPANTDNAFVPIGLGLEFRQLTTSSVVLWPVNGVDMGSTIGPIEARVQKWYSIKLKCVKIGHLEPWVSRKWTRNSGDKVSFLPKIFKKVGK
jgi:hypothetical protein